MRYWNLADRKVSAYGAILIIAVVASMAAAYIVHDIDTINFNYSGNGL